MHRLALSSAGIISLDVSVSILVLCRSRQLSSELLAEMIAMKSNERICIIMINCSGDRYHYTSASCSTVHRVQHYRKTCQGDHSDKATTCP